ncbi:hypothetical protein MASR1M90_19340 [Desulfovibrionales bacterium]
MSIKTICFVSIFSAFFILNTGCSWVGQTSGKVQAKLERKAQAVTDGYHKGYENEKNKQQ